MLITIIALNSAKIYIRSFNYKVYTDNMDVLIFTIIWRFIRDNPSQGF